MVRMATGAPDWRSEYTVNMTVGEWTMTAIERPLTNENPVVAAATPVTKPTVAPGAKIGEIALAPSKKSD